jgi:type I restriction enzyme S subunit
MAAEYESVKLGDVASVRSGFAFKSGDWTDSGVPVVKIANVKDGRLDMEGCSYVTPEIAGTAAEFALEVGDILIAMTGYIGDVALVRPSDLPAVLNQRVGRFSIRDSRRLDRRFLFYLLRSADIRSEIEGLGYGSAQPNVSPSLVHGVQVPLPSLSEQRAIAHILGTVDDKIELNRRVNETLEAMARALFKSWFVDFDPVRAKAEGRNPGLPQALADLFPERVVNSELGQIPEGWEVGRFGDVVDQVRDQEDPLSSPDALFSHYSIPAFDEGRGPETELGESIKSLKSRVPPACILLSKLNPEIERVWLVDIRSDERAVCSTEFVVLRARAPFTRSYAYCVARSPVFRRQLESLVTGTSKSHQRAQVDAILDLGVLVAPCAIVEAFDRSGSSLLGRTLGHRRESRTLAALRDTLLPKLISGELRVKDVDRFIEKHL